MDTNKVYLDASKETLQIRVNQLMYENKALIDKNEFLQEKIDYYVSFIEKQQFVINKLINFMEE